MGSLFTYSFRAFQWLDIITLYDASRKETVTDNATYQEHKRFEKREGSPVSPGMQRRTDNLNSIKERLNETRTRALHTMSDLLDEKGSSYLVENYLSVLIECDAKLNALSRYEWWLLENRVSDLR